MIPPLIVFPGTFVPSLSVTSADDNTIPPFADTKAPLSSFHDPIYPSSALIVPFKLTFDA
jgi:hypothetical protein